MIDDPLDQFQHRSEIGMNFVAQALLPVLERDLKDAGTDKSVCATSVRITPKTA